MRYSVNRESNVRSFCISPEYSLYFSPYEVIRVRWTVARLGSRSISICVLLRSFSS